MSESFSDIIKHHKQFQVFVESNSDEIELLSTLLMAGFPKTNDIVVYMNNASLRNKDKYYPRQLFFKWDTYGDWDAYGYTFEGWMDLKNFSNLFDQKNFTPFMFQEVMEYYYEPPFNDNGDDLSDDGEYNISDLIEV